MRGSSVGNRHQGCKGPELQEKNPIMPVSSLFRIGLYAGIWCMFLVIGCGSSQEPLRLSTNRIVLQPKRDASGPDIQLVQPSLPEGRALFVQDDQLVVRGRASDPSGLRNLTVAGIETVIDPTGSFSVRLRLKQGKNAVRVSAEDILGNPSSIEFEVVCDTRPPAVEILHPPVDTRSGSIAIPEGPVVLRGKVSDVSGVTSVIINGRQVVLNQDTTFEYTLVDADTVQITVTDGSGLKTVQTLACVRPKPRSPAEALAGKNCALVIGIDRYRGSWRPLKTSVRDATRLAEELRGTYGFARLWSLFNEQATRASILGLLRQLDDSLTAADNLLVFFSGHGLRKAASGEGFWVPVDATVGDASESLIANQEIVEMLGTMKLCHILVVADATFTGKLLRSLSSSHAERTSSSIALRQSRNVITSGSDAPVEGGREKHSVFAYQLINVLRTIKEEYATGGDVLARVQRELGASGLRHQPAFWSVEAAGHEGGEFIFVRKQNNTGSRTSGQ